MDDHNLHLVDQDALDLRRCLTYGFQLPAELIDIMSSESVWDVDMNILAFLSVSPFME
jgi:hypothetical protein